MREHSTDENEHTKRLAVRRRPILGSLGTLGVAGGLGLGFTAGTTTAQQTDADDWEAAADDRIQEHRTADLEVQVVDEDGTEVDSARVDVAMQDHEYDFGGMIDAEFLVDGTEWGEEIHTDADQANFRESVEQLFNTVVLENLHKWNLWQDNVDIADAAVDWALERDLDVRGHVCVWGNVGAHAIPPDVVEAMGVEWEDGGVTDPDHDPDYVREQSMAHIEEIITHYGDDIQEWEIVNEALHETAMIEAVDGEDADPTEAEILGDWYEHAAEIANEEGVDIAINDYNTLAGPHEGTRDRYESQIDYLVNDRGVDLDGIGMQSHFANSETLAADEILEGLDRYTGYGAGFRATEFDTFQGNWDSPEAQGEYLYEFLKTFFSHPETEAFVVWGHWDGVHWAPDYDGSDPDGVFFDQEWNPKPAYDYYVSLVFDEWWTDETGETDGGTYETTGFKGEYEIAAWHDGMEGTATATLSDGGETVEITLDEAGEPPADEDSSDAVVDLDLADVSNGANETTDGDDSADSDGTDGSDDDSDTDSQSDDETDGLVDSVPGLGIVSALAGLTGAAGYALRQRDDEDA